MYITTDDVKVIVTTKYSGSSIIPDGHGIATNIDELLRKYDILDHDKVLNWQRAVAARHIGRQINEETVLYIARCVQDGINRFIDEGVLASERRIKKGDHHLTFSGWTNLYSSVTKSVEGFLIRHESLGEYAVTENVFIQMVANSVIDGKLESQMEMPQYLLHLLEVNDVLYIDKTTDSESDHIRYSTTYDFGNTSIEQRACLIWIKSEYGIPTNAFRVDFMEDAKEYLYKTLNGVLKTESDS